MKLKSFNLLSIVAALGMIGGGILAIYDEEAVYVALGIYFIAKGFFVLSLMQRLKRMSCNCCKKA